MRIDALAIENIASLVGQQQIIDLRLGRPPVGGAGLIAITGPTGAGKSTILDCVCLALFGQTPRQLIRQGEPGALLSRSASAGQVVLDLTLDDGTPWRVTWSIRRARDRLDQKLQPAVRSIIDPRTDAVLASGSSEVSRLVSEGLRLTLEQFSSVILLAQGDFARFLRANDTERAGLLELLTGTALYSRLGQAAYERWKELDLQCHGQDALLAQVPVLAEEARAALAAEQAELQGRRAAATAEINRRIADRDAVALWMRLQHELSQAEAACDESARDATVAVGDRERLRLAEAVVPVLIPLAGVDAAAAHVQTCRTRAQDAAAKATAAEKEFHTSAHQAGVAIAQAAGRASRRAAEAETRAAWAAIPSQVVDQLREAHAVAITVARQGAESLAACTSLKALLPSLESDLEKATRAYDVQIAVQTQAFDALRDRDQAIATLLHGRSIEDLNARQQVLIQARELIRGPVPDTQGARAAVAEADRQVHQLTQDLAEGQRVSALALQAVTAQEAQLRRLEELARLGAFAHLVVDGQPCPLCGSMTHPTPTGDGDLGLTTVRGDVEALRKAQDLAHQRMLHAQALLATGQARRQQLQISAQRVDQEAAARLTRWAPLGKALSYPGEPQAVTLAEIETECASVADDLQRHAAAQRNREACQRALTAAESQLATAQTRKALAAQALEQARTRLTESTLAVTRFEGEQREADGHVNRQLSTLCATLGCQIPSPPGAWIADLPRQCEEARLLASTALVLARDVENLTVDWQTIMPAGVELPAGAGPELAGDDRRLVEEAGTALRAAAARNTAAATMARESVTHNEAVLEAERVLTATHRDLTLALASCPCPTIEAVRQAQLSDAERAGLRRKLELLDQTTAIRTSNRERLRAEMADAVCGLQDRKLDPNETQLLERCEGLCTEGERLRGDVDRRMGEVQALLEQDRQACERRLAIIATQANQRGLRDRADRIRQLIGSADGSRFSRFAQALTLDLLVSYANHRLLTLAPRYQLRRDGDVRDGEPSLALGVIDHDQAESERSISTLSGGETFLVSLALALALADIHRGRLTVGTLCIDEGFGTLDEQTLAHAMATLERLQVSQGTQILLISHITALNERIAHRIEVVPRGGGASWVRLVGPDGTAATMPSLPPVAESDAADLAAREVLMGAIQARGIISSADGQDLVRRDAGGVRSLLKGLIDDGRVVMEGRGKGVRFRLPTAALNPGTPDG